MTTAQSELAARFRAMHHEAILVLPNAFDVASARIVQEAGAKAVATTSAGVSWAWGVPDGEGLGIGPVVDLTRRIAAAVGVPVSVDVEGGYSEDLDRLAATVNSVLRAGAVGINIEDGHGFVLRSVEEQARRLACVRETARSAGIDLYVNARTDTYLRGIGEPEGRLEETVRRADAYLGAGASGVFVPGVADPRVIEALAARIDAPLNVLVGPGSPSVKELAGLGVARVSAGSSIAQGVYAYVQRAADELLSEGTYSTLGGGSDYQALNGLLAR